MQAKGWFSDRLLIKVLHDLYGEIFTTPAVQRELYILEEQEKQIEEIEWIKVKSPQNQKLVVKLLAELDLGESESIASAIEENAKYLIIDEYKGRMIADQNGVKVVGILGVLIQAKKRGIIPLVKPYIDKLIEVGFRLDPKLIEKVLKKLEE